jgi:hypothetical protein
MIESRVVRGGAAFPDENVIETLTIDDHTVSVRSPWTLEGRHVTEARDTVSRSSAARSRFGATEAESKAVRDASEATLTGAQILGNEGYVGAPDTRRLALQVRSFQLAKLPVISTLAAEMFTGSWTAVAMYRRPILVVFRHMYEFNSLEPKAVYRFGAKAREELILAACLAPLAVTDLRAQVPQKLWALDASPSKGAYVSTPVSLPLSRALWRHGERRGKYSKLETGPRRVLVEHGWLAPEQELDAFQDHGEASSWQTPQREIAFLYDVLAIGRNASLHVKACADLGLICGPACSREASPHFAVEDSRFLEWVVWLLAEGRLLFVIVEPPCGTFAPAYRPAVRSYGVPLGFERADPATRRGNAIATRSISILWAAQRYQAGGILLQPVAEAFA